VWPKGGDLWELDAATGRERKLLELPSAAVITGASWSPDGREVVYAQVSRRQGTQASGADLFVISRDGGEPWVFVERDAPTTIFETPVWALDGRVYYTVRRFQGNREATSIERATADGTREQLVADATGPTLPPDGLTLGYVRPSPSGQTLWQQPTDAPERACTLATLQTPLATLGSPRFAPDGQRLAFAAGGEPGRATERPCPSAAAGCSELAPRLLHRFGLWPLEAHARGLPSDAWSIGVTGGTPERLASLVQDDPSLAWAPDGRELATLSPAGMFIVDLTNGRQRRISETGGYGAFDWTR